MSIPLHDWVAKQRRSFEALAGTAVTHYAAVEMAFLDQGSDGTPVFGQDDAPFQQLSWLRICLADGAEIPVQTYQSDDAFGLWIPDASTLERVNHSTEFEEGSIYRSADLGHLPTGRIERVRVEPNEYGDLSVVTLEFAKSQLDLVAGEVHEQREGPPTVVFGDESILIFNDPRVRHSLMSQGPVVRLDRW